MKLENVKQAGRAMKDKITEEAANGAERAVKAPWKAAVVVMAALAVAFAAGAILL